MQEESSAEVSSSFFVQCSLSWHSAPRTFATLVSLNFALFPQLRETTGPWVSLFCDGNPKQLAEAIAGLISFLSLLSGIIVQIERNFLK